MIDKDNQSYAEGAKAFQEWLMDNKVVSIATEWLSESSNTRSTGEVLVAVDTATGATVSNLKGKNVVVWENALEVFLKELELDYTRNTDDISTESDPTDDIDP